jgi:hypothetical protein
LQPSEAPGITTDTNNNNTTLQPLAQVNTHQNNDKSTQENPFSFFLKDPLSPQ